MYQVNQKGEEKELPYPTKIFMVKRGNARWSAELEQFKAFIVLDFDDRTDVTVYFKEIVEWREIGMFLEAKMQKKKGIGLGKLAERWKESVAG